MGQVIRIDPPTSLREVVALADRIALDTAILPKDGISEYLVGKYGWLGLDFPKAVAKIAKDLQGLHEDLEKIDRNIGGVRSAYLLSKAPRSVRVEVFSRAVTESLSQEDILEILAHHKEQARIERELKKEENARTLYQGKLYSREGQAIVHAEISMRLHDKLQIEIEESNTISQALDDLVFNVNGKDSEDADMVIVPIATAELIEAENWDRINEVVGWSDDCHRNLALFAKSFSRGLSLVEEPELSSVKEVLIEVFARTCQEDDLAFYKAAWVGKRLIEKILNPENGYLSKQRIIQLVQIAAERGDENSRNLLLERVPRWILPYTSDPVRLYMADAIDLAEVGMNVRLHYKGCEAKIYEVQAVDLDRGRIGLVVEDGKTSYFTGFHLSYANQLLD